MTEIKFPRKRDDGSFTIAASFSTPDEKTVALVREYLGAWTRANKTWTRIWRSETICEERLEFDEEFSAEPTLERGVDALRFAIVLQGRTSARRWKDWLVFLTDDLCKVFPEIKFEGFNS